MRRYPPLPALAAAAVLVAAGCQPELDEDALTGRVVIDGSSATFPITEAVAEEFQLANRGVRVTVGVSGTGGGFTRFCAGETDVSNASRPITDAEQELCEANGIEHMVFVVAWDGVSVVTHRDNDWAQCLTVEELRRVWQPGSTIRRWNQIRADWPDRPLELYGPYTDSGTFHFFTENIVGEATSSRSDYTGSNDQNVVAMGVAGDRRSLGYFGYAYYYMNQHRLRLVAVDAGDGCVKPTRETVEREIYRPLSRPMRIYVNRASLQRPQVRAFVEFYLEHATDLVPSVGYIPLSRERYEEQLQRLREAGAAPER